MSETFKTIALIEALKGNGGGGSSLPSVTSSDNGKVLAVKDGAWAADSNLLLVGRTGSSLDYTYAEIKAAIDAGREVELSINNNRYSYAGIYNNTIYFTMEQPSNESSFVTIYGVKSDNTYVTKQFPYLPIVTNADVGKELVPKSGAWVKQQKKFIVTLTPTSPDYSGTMDKTPEEITAAYNAGQEIVFDIPALSAKIHANQFLVVNDVIKAGGMVFYDVNSSPVIITVVTDSSASTYATQVFAMTPAS